MKKLLTIIFLLTCWNSFADHWTQKANSPTSFLVGTFSFSIGNKGYVGGGHDTVGYNTSTMWEYDPVSDTWSQKANFGGGGRTFATACSILGKGYVGLGETQSLVIMNDWWEYDLIANTWTQKANFGGGNRFYPVAFTIDSLGYVCSGYGFDTTYHCYNDLWQYSPVTDSWTQKTSLPGLERENAFAFAINGKGYVGGGMLCGPPYTIPFDFWEYEPISDAWTQKANIPDSVWVDACAFSIGNFGYLGIGENPAVSSDFWQYSPATNQWTQKATFPGTARDEEAFFAAGGKGYVGLGGQNSHPVFYDFYEYTPDSTTGVFESSNTNLNVAVSPIPFIEKLNVFCTNNELLEIILYDISSRKLFQEEFTNSVSLNTEQLAKGIYIYEVRNKNGVIKQGKVVKQ